jgi:hypothetical protein
MGKYTNIYRLGIARIPAIPARGMGIYIISWLHVPRVVIGG